MRWLRAPCALLAVAAGSAQAQTMLDQEQRLIEIHSLLVALQPGNAPGAYRAGELSLGLEIIGIPPIDGTTGGKRQITASDRTFAFPRPRFALGLPAPADFRAFVGLSYIPPIPINEVSSHLGALEAGLAWVPDGPLATPSTTSSSGPIFLPATGSTSAGAASRRLPVPVSRAWPAIFTSPATTTC